ncbi:MAG: primosomal protein N' [Bacteroidaceae bacterium]|nr:primosomal protein N' [Bacteroidaceae bacterium]
MPLYADIVLPVPFDSFTYAVPVDLQAKAVRGCRVVVPFGKSKIYTGVVIRTHDKQPVGVEVKQIMEVLDEEPVVNEQQFLFWRWVADYYLCPLGDVYKAALPGGAKKGKTLSPSPLTFQPISVPSEHPPLCGEICHSDGLPSHRGTGVFLNNAQQQAMNEIDTAFETKDITLLHGVTSSGKTEIYIHLITKYIKEGKQVLYLLPEIALTTQITERLRAVFGDEMGVYHSKFTEVQRLKVYGRQLSGHPYGVILGVRSSLFLPFQNLGLVIVDEEHETSYKQQEPAPRYHARNAAMMLARMFGAKTLLGTATPSFETYHSAKKGRYGYVQLTQRYGGMLLPEIHVIDMMEMRHKKMVAGAFSVPLIEEIREALGRKEQVILFQNRRGFAHFLECRQCGWVPRCPHCDVSLTYHKKTQLLTCHYCGYVTRPADQCPNCGEARFVDVGLGTEKVEDQTMRLFPDATVLRMDLDTAKTRNQCERIIRDFSAGKADILIGTQMVTKGLDFDNVGVVGILNANTLLNQPDFRSYERTFHVVSQVAGRAGRKNTSGRVFLQTSSADSDIVRQIAGNDYWGMFYQQMTERRAFGYPPFSRLIYVYLRHRDVSLLEHLAQDMAEKMRGVFGDRVLGPDQPPVSRIQSLHIRKIVLKLELTMSVDRVRRELVRIQGEVVSAPVAKNLNVYYDVDPQ